MARVPTPLPVSDRAIAAMAICHAAGAVVIGIAMVALLLGAIKVAVAAVLVVLFLLIFSLEALRVLVLSIREYRR